MGQGKSCARPRPYEPLRRYRRRWIQTFTKESCPLSKQMDGGTAQTVVNVFGIVAVAGVAYMIGWWNRGRIDRQRYGLDMLEGVQVVHP
jgi:hypothetical protein